MTALTIKDIVAIDGEPRIRDLDLAERLEMVGHYKIRTLIAANREELEMHGEVSTRRVETTSRGGRPSTAYYLNEAQALTICALSRTPVAAKIRRHMIRVFIAWRQSAVEKPVQVVAHRRRLPAKIAPPVINRRDRFESFFRAFRDQPEALAEWADHHAELMEQMLSSFTGRPRSR